MKTIQFSCLFLTMVSLFFSQTVNAQVNVEVTINDASVTTTCGDFITAPDPLWRVNIENEGWEFYPAVATCFNALPNTQYTASYSCPSDVPASIEICFAVFENDETLFEIGIGCDIDESCAVSICQDFTIPPAGQSEDLTISIPANQASGGEMEFTIDVIPNGVATSDLPCDAIDLGIIGYDNSINPGIDFSNNCANNIGEPNPSDDGFWYNDAGVWFTFTTDDNPANMIFIQGLNDPNGTGDEIDMQMALYQPDNGNCTDNMELLFSAVDNNSMETRVKANCLEPNTTYYLLVDGDPGSVAEHGRGIFGLQLDAIGVVEGGDLRCDAEFLGIVPEGGSVETPGPRANYCATNSDDPFVQAFSSQKSVWFSFVPPPSGHVYIQGVSDLETDPIGVQLALYRSFNNTCGGFFSHITSSFTGDEFEETIERSCLDPDRTYYVLVDGSGSQKDGFFTLSVTDAGDDTPRTDIDTTVCSGNPTFPFTGVFSDTLNVFGCDSIVNYNVTVIDPIMIEIDQTRPALGIGNADGIATANASGGTGNYTYEWCTGGTEMTDSTLVGGDMCCVTVTDDFGCEAIECFSVEFIMPIIPTFTADTLSCNGDSDGVITFSAIQGLPPYNYSWELIGEAPNGSGVINAEDEEISIVDLPAGAYEITIADDFFDTTFVVNILEPEPLEVSLLDQQDASCFSFCDGTVEVAAQGGTGDYQFAWSGGLDGVANPAGICAGNYSLTVTDENGCTAELEITLDEPAEFVASLSVDQPISCFEGTDGVISVSTNGNPASYAWNNGESTAVITGLEAGIYEVTVTNEDDCEDITFLTLMDPDEPVGVDLSVVKPVSCNGELDAIAMAQATGPGTVFEYNWSSGGQQAEEDGLGAGTYMVTVTNELGCEAMSVLTIDEPDVISADVIVEDVNCLNEPNGGVVQVENTSGGVPDYRYSLDGILFGSTASFGGLFAGSYEVIVEDAAGCEASFPVTVNGPPELVLTLGQDTVIQLGQAITLSAEANSTDLIYKWSPVDSLNAGTGNTLEVQPTETTNYVVEIQDSVTFCTARDAILVRVNQDRNIYIPNAFSPANKDGNNDLFLIFAGYGVEQVKSLRVFDRRGSLVFEQEGFPPENPTFGWDGTFRGQELNSGVYVYVAEIEFIDGKVEVFKGEVVLVK